MSTFHSIHLTEQAFEQATSLFDAAFKGSLDLVSLSSSADVDWDSFDSVYLYLYRLSLLRRRASGREASRQASFPLAAPGDRGVRPMLKVEHTLDMELADEDNPRCLLSEFAVHSLMDFRSAFRATVEFDAEVTYVDIGCVMLGFGVRFPSSEGIFYLTYPLFGVGSAP